MATVFAGGFTPFGRSRTHEGGTCWSQRPVAGAEHAFALKNRPHLLVFKRWGRRFGVLCKAGYGARPTFIACLLYFPRYSAACMAMMRPELLAQEACEPGARETS